MFFNQLSRKAFQFLDLVQSFGVKVKSRFGEAIWFAYFLIAVILGFFAISKFVFNLVSSSGSIGETQTGMPNHVDPAGSFLFSTDSDPADSCSIIKGIQERLVTIGEAIIKVKARLNDPLVFDREREVLLSEMTILSEEQVKINLELKTISEASQFSC